MACLGVGKEPICQMGAPLYHVSPLLRLGMGMTWIWRSTLGLGSDWAPASTSDCDRGWGRLELSACRAGPFSRCCWVWGLKRLSVWKELGWGLQQLNFSCESCATIM